MANSMRIADHKPVVVKHFAFCDRFFAYIASDYRYHYASWFF